MQGLPFGHAMPFMKKETLAGAEAQIPGFVEIALAGREDGALGVAYGQKVDMTDRSKLLIEFQTIDEVGGTNSEQTTSVVSIKYDESGSL